MIRFLQIAALSAMFLVLASNQADANSGGSKGSAGSHKSMSGSSHHNVSKTYPHNHRWSSRYWNSRYRCEFCYSPVDSCYFYFYAPTNCYYPISYIEQFPPQVAPVPAPTPTTALPTVTLPAPVVNVNQNTNVVR